MHKLIPIEFLAETAAQSQEKCLDTCPIKLENQDLGTSTLSLILHTISKRKNEADLSAIKLKQIYTHWQSTLELEINNSQMQKSIRILMNYWIELQIDSSVSLHEKNEKLASLLKHMNTCIHVFNLASNRKAIKVLHYIMLHPIILPSSDLMQKQAELHSIIASHYHVLEERPSYQKIANRLFISKTNKTRYIRNTIYMTMGILVGFVSANMLHFQSFKMCSP